MHSPRLAELAAQPAPIMLRIVARPLLCVKHLSIAASHRDLDSVHPRRCLWQAENRPEQLHNDSAQSRAYQYCAASPLPRRGHLPPGGYSTPAHSTRAPPASSPTRRTPGPDCSASSLPPIGRLPPGRYPTPAHSTRALPASSPTRRTPCPDCSAWHPHPYDLLLPC